MLGKEGGNDFGKRKGKKGKTVARGEKKERTFRDKRLGLYYVEKNWKES